MMFAFEGNAFPIDKEMMDYLREEGVIDEETTIEEAQKFVENHIKGEEIYDFYWVLRRAALERQKGEVMTDRLPADTLRLGLPSGSLQQSTIDLFGRAGYRINIAERSVFPRIDDEKLSAVLFAPRRSAGMWPTTSSIAA